MRSRASWGCRGTLGHHPGRGPPTWTRCMKRQCRMYSQSAASRQEGRRPLSQVGWTLCSLALRDQSRQMRCRYVAEPTRTAVGDSSCTQAFRDRRFETCSKVPARSRGNRCRGRAQTALVLIERPSGPYVPVTQTSALAGDRRAPCLPRTRNAAQRRCRQRGGPAKAEQDAESSSRPG